MCAGDIFIPRVRFLVIGMLAKKGRSTPVETLFELLLASETFLFYSSLWHVKIYPEHSDTQRGDTFFFLFPQNIAKYLKADNT